MLTKTKLKENNNCVNVLTKHEFISTQQAQKPFVKCNHHLNHNNFANNINNPSKRKHTLPQ